MEPGWSCGAFPCFLTERFERASVLYFLFRRNRDSPFKRPADGPERTRETPQQRLRHSQRGAGEPGSGARIGSENCVSCGATERSEGGPRVAARSERIRRAARNSRSAVGNIARPAQLNGPTGERPAGRNRRGGSRWKAQRRLSVRQAGGSSCGGGGGASRTLHYASAMVRTLVGGSFEPSIPIQGGSA